MFNIMGELSHARLFIIDCMPNMDSRERADSIVPRLIRGIKHLRTKTSAPIMLVEHDGYCNDKTKDELKIKVEYANARLREAYEYLLRCGTKDIEYLTKEELGLANDQECQIDGLHATDIGMRLYAEAYERKIMLKK